MKLTDRPLYSRFGVEIAKQLAVESGATETSRFPDGRLTKYVFAGIVDVEQIGHDLFVEGWEVSTEAIRRRLTPADVVASARERVKSAQDWLRRAEQDLAYVEEWASLPSTVLPTPCRPTAKDVRGRSDNPARPNAQRVPSNAIDH